MKRTVRIVVGCTLLAGVAPALASKCPPDSVKVGTVCYRHLRGERVADSALEHLAREAGAGGQGNAREADRPFGTGIHRIRPFPSPFAKSAFMAPMSSEQEPTIANTTTDWLFGVLVV